MEYGNGAQLDNSSLVLSKIGGIVVRWSPLVEGTPKTITISREADGWRVCFSCADVQVQSLPETEQETGVDLGIESFATRSDGTDIFNPCWRRTAGHTLRTAQRRVSRRKNGSNRRRKAVQLLAKARLKVKKQRADFYHKTALAQARANDTINHEDLQTANLLWNHHLAKSIHAAAKNRERPGRTIGEPRRWLRRGTEYPWDFSASGVSNGRETDRAEASVPGAAHGIGLPRGVGHRSVSAPRALS
jgi:putative transposase